MLRTRTYFQMRKHHNHRPKKDFSLIRYIKTMVTMWVYNLKKQNEACKKTSRQTKGALGWPVNGSPNSFLFYKKKKDSNHSFSSTSLDTLTPLNQNSKPLKLSPYLFHLPALDLKNSFFSSSLKARRKHSFLFSFTAQFLPKEPTLKSPSWCHFIGPRSAYVIA